MIGVNFNFFFDFRFEQTRRLQQKNHFTVAMREMRNQRGRACKRRVFDLVVGKRRDVAHFFDPQRHTPRRSLQHHQTVAQSWRARNLSQARRQIDDRQNLAAHVDDTRHKMRSLRQRFERWQRMNFLHARHLNRIQRTARHQQKIFFVDPRVIVIQRIHTSRVRQLRVKHES